MDFLLSVHVKLNVKKENLLIHNARIHSNHLRMHLHFKSSILDYIHLSPSTWSITLTAMKLCSLLFQLLDFDRTNRLEEQHISALLTYLTNLNQNQISTIFYKLGRIESL